MCLKTKSSLKKLTLVALEIVLHGSRGKSICSRVESVYSHGGTIQTVPSWLQRDSPGRPGSTLYG